jgi:hypothetical protein
VLHSTITHLSSNKSLSQIEYRIEKEIERHMEFGALKCIIIESPFKNQSRSMNTQQLRVLLLYNISVTKVAPTKKDEHKGQY